VIPRGRVRRRAGGPRRADRGQRGLTLIELMIAMLISSLLIGMVFSIYTRMSVAYRQQNLVTELQQTLRAAQTVMLRDLRQAGYMIPDGFRTEDLADADADLPPLSIINNADGTGPDSIRMYYADGSRQARILTLAPIAAFVNASVDDTTPFEGVTRAVMVNPTVPLDTVTTDGIAPIATFIACVVTVTGVDPGLLTFDPNPQCAALKTAHDADGATPQTMVYPFIGRSYRIDPNRKAFSVLQQSPSGELTANDWTDLGIGFTDLQLASRFTLEVAGADQDGDGDPLRDWFSSENQEIGDVGYPIGARLTHLGVSFAVRTYENVNLVTSAQTPAFIDDSSSTATEHNRRGDAPSVQLEGVPDAARPEEHRGARIYRWSSNVVDLRNLGVGQ
jgi:prepilin-type N-terminal cleavage/methylation domain-containing protein